MDCGIVHHRPLERGVLGYLCASSPVIGRAVVWNVVIGMVGAIVADPFSLLTGVGSNDKLMVVGAFVGGGTSVATLSGTAISTGDSWSSAAGMLSTAG